VVDSWDDVLRNLTSEDSFVNQIQNRGYYLSELSYQKLIKKHGFSHSQNAAGFLSLDFLSKQSKILREKNMYLLRTGKGNFAIFDEQKFPHSYLNLNTNNAEKLEIDSSGFPELLHAFETRQENAALEQLNVLGVYDLLVKNVLGVTEWKIGPRGNKTSTFPVYAKNNSAEVNLIYTYDGQEELDYTIWTRDHVLLFEAKSLKSNMGLDVGWHKLAYPASRFKKYSKYKIKPIYFLKWEKTIHLFVFPDFEFHKDGIIINDEKAFVPERIFRIDLDKTLFDYHND